GKTRGNSSLSALQSGRGAVGEGIEATLYGVGKPLDGGLQVVVVSVGGSPEHVGIAKSDVHFT
ncbi:MAG: hypothetical protein ACXWM7_06740, partial [Parachlamydiaceae bacterium]